MRGAAIAVVMLAAAAFFIVVALDQHRAAKREVLDQYNRFQEEQVANAASKIERSLRLCKEELQMLASYRFGGGSAKPSPDWSLLHEFYRRMSPGECGALTVLSASGEVLHSAQTATRDRAASLRKLWEWTVRAETDGAMFRLFGPLRNSLEEQQGRPPEAVLAFVAPIYRPVGVLDLHEFDGAMILELNIAHVLIDAMALVEEVDDSDLWVMDVTGTLLWHSEHPEMVLNRVARKEEAEEQGCTDCHTSFAYVDEILKHRRGTAAYQLRDSPRKIAAFESMRFENAAWAVVINSSAEGVTTFLSDSARQTYLLLAAVLIVLSSGFLLSFRSYRKRLQAEEHRRIDRIGHLASLGEMASGLAHEIKNPLAGLSGAVQVFGEAFREGSEEGEVVDLMEAQIGRLDRTMNELLRFARPTAPDLQAVDVNPLLDRVLFLLKKQQDGSGIEFQEDLGAARLVIADAFQLEQVFLNLGLNALQAMRGTGTLSIASRDERDEVVVVVANTGRGIELEHRPNLFKPFFTTKTSGTGLGLTISRRIVEDHHGRIDFECPRSGGTVFTVRLHSQMPTDPESIPGAQ
jgi:signal transduction histidine kinase